MRSKISTCIWLWTRGPRRHTNDAVRTRVHAVQCSRACAHVHVSPSTHVHTFPATHSFFHAPSLRLHKAFIKSYWKLLSQYSILFIPANRTQNKSASWLRMCYFESAGMFCVRDVCFLRKRMNILASLCCLRGGMRGGRREKSIDGCRGIERGRREDGFPEERVAVSPSETSNTQRLCDHCSS